MMPESTTQLPESNSAFPDQQTGFDSPAASFGEQVQDGAESLTTTAKEAVRGAGEQIRQTAQAATERVKTESAGMAEGQKSRAADQLGAFSAAIRSAADRLHNENDHRIAEYAEAAADRVDGAARYLQDHKLSGIVGDLERLARSQPELFLGGMFLAGMGISRFLKASRPQAQTTSSVTRASSQSGGSAPLGW